MINLLLLKFSNVWEVFSSLVEKAVLIIIVEILKFPNVLGVKERYKSFSMI